MKPAKPTDATKRLFADCPLDVRKLNAQAVKERRAAARAAYAKANSLNRPA